MLTFATGEFQCYTSSDCTGTVINSTDQRDCCVGTNDGLSYGDGNTCNCCIGMANNNMEVCQVIIEYYVFFSVHGFHLAKYDVIEGEHLNTTFGPNIKGTTTFSQLLLALAFDGTIIAQPDGTASK